MGATGYSALALWGFGFWAVTVVAGIIMFISFCEMMKTYNNHRQDAVNVFLGTGFVALLLIHLFGDYRVFGWLYMPANAPPADVVVANSIFVPFGILFWTLILAELGTAVFCVRSKNGVAGLVSILLTAGLIQFLTGVPVLSFFVHSPLYTVIGLVGWLFAGLIWAFWKWDKFSADHRRRYDAKFAAWCAEKHIVNDWDQLTNEQKGAWQYHFFRNNGNPAINANRADEQGFIEYRPRYQDHKSELLGWISLWPISIFEYFLFDFVADVLEYVWLQLGSLLQAIMMRRWRGSELLDDEFMANYHAVQQRTEENEETEEN